MFKFSKTACYATLIGAALAAQAASAAVIDRDFVGGLCESQSLSGVLKGTFVCDDDGKTYFGSIFDVYKSGFRVVHVTEAKTIKGDTVKMIVVEKK